ncbi:MAG: hypothetical protein A2Z18_01405 [Armatimonadetes bacterium RBG_16_58_9]|nr:MAG: hypothetical protein A2Z18_01405 [Armatimonadetes bacterium RBG_16_58_9]
MTHYVGGADSEPTKLKTSLKFKLTGCVAIVLILIYAALLVAETRLVTDELAAKARSSSRMLSLTVEKSLRNAMMKRRRDEVSAIVSSVAELPDIRRMAILDGDGRTALGSPGGPRGRTNPQVQEMVKSAIRTGNWVSRGARNDILRTVSPIRNEKRCWSCHGSSKPYLGHLLIDLSTRADRLALARNRKTLVAGGVTALLITVVTLLLMLSSLVHRPIGRLMATMMRIKDGDISTRADTSAGDELRRLSEALNAMVIGLEERNVEIMKARERLLETRRLATVGLLAAGMAHEVNNPTATIFVAAEGLARYVPAGSQGRNLLDSISRSAERISCIVSDLLRFDPNQPMRSEPIDINELVKEVVNSAAEALAGTGHNVTLALTADAEGLIGDAERLRLAIANVVTNAFEAIPEGGDLSVRTASTENDVEIVVSDTGHGISPEDLPRVTDPFFTRKETDGARGLGLAIAREIVAQHGGEIEIFSSPNEGTSVSIRIAKHNYG